MQAASEMYAKLHNRATDVARAVEQRLKIKAAKKQLDVLLTGSLLTHLWEKAGTSATVDCVGVDAAGRELGAMSTPQWTVGVAMGLLKKLSTAPAYLTSTVHWATVVPASKVVHTLQTGWENIKPTMYGKNAPSADYKIQEEQRNDAPVDISAGTADAVEPRAERTTELCQAGYEVRTGETTQSIDGENVEVSTEPAGSSHVETAACTEEPAGSSHVETAACTEEPAGSNTETDEVCCSSHSVSADIGETQQPTAQVQSSTQDKSEANTAAPRPRSKTFYSLFRRSAASQHPKEY